MIQPLSGDSSVLDICLIKQLSGDLTKPSPGCRAEILSVLLLSLAPALLSRKLATARTAAGGLESAAPCPLLLLLVPFSQREAIADEKICADQITDSNRVDIIPIRVIRASRGAF
jgi:hypothetical protein